MINAIRTIAATTPPRRTGDNGNAAAGAELILRLMVSEFVIGPLGPVALPMIVMV